MPEFFLEPHWAGKNPFAVLALEQNEIVGVMTGLHPGGRVISGLPARPQLCMIDGKQNVAASALLNGLLQESGSSKLIEVFAWHSSPLAIFEQNGFWKTQLEGDVVLDLRAGADALFNKFHENRKRNIRAAQRNGVVVSEASDDDFDAYWEVYCGWQKSGRKKIHARATFENASKVHHLKLTHRRFLARYQGKVIAATTVRFCPGGLIEYAGNCSLDEFNRLRPNDLLIWRTIQWACEQAFPKYSLGAAHPFLRKCGGVVEPIDRYRLDRTPMKYHDLGDKLTAMPRRVFYSLPDPVQKAVLGVVGKRRIGE